MTRQRVLFVTSWYPTDTEDAAGIFVREHARAAALHHEVRVLHLAPEDPALGGHHAITQVRPPALTCGLTTYRATYRRLANLRGGTRALSSARAARAVARTGFRPTIVHANIHDTALHALVMGRLFRCPVVLTEHSSAFPRQQLTAGQVRRARWSFSRMAAVLPVSDALAEGIASHGISARFRTVPNAVDTDVFHPPPAFIPTPVARLLFVGYLKPVKGLPVLLKALAGVHRRDSGWHLDIIGDGEQRTELEGLCGRLGISNRVRFRGFQPKDRVAEAMRSHDLLVLPSDWENLPCVALEALCSGLPVLATRVGGIPEIIDDRNGALVPPNDQHALTQALETLFQEPGHDRTELADRARRRYSLEAVGEQLDDVYGQALTGR